VKDHLNSSDKEEDKKIIQLLSRSQSKMNDRYVEKEQPFSLVSQTTSIIEAIESMEDPQDGIRKTKTFKTIDVHNACND
jgi:hypothetical protein